MDRIMSINIEQLELSQLDTRFEKLKTRDSGAEKALLASLIEGRVCEPLLVTRERDSCIVLDGFKRFRAIRTLKWGTVACSFIGASEAEGVMEYLKRSRGNKTTMYEEACFVRRLHKEHSMSNHRIATHLQRSKGWVSMRLTFFDGMNESARENIQTGRFPLHAWMYTVRPFMRMNDTSRALVGEFVGHIDVREFSLRDIDLLAEAWFNGGDALRNEIRQGKGGRVLRRAQAVVEDGLAMSAAEQATLKSLARLVDGISTWTARSHSDITNASREFKAQAHLVSAQALGLLQKFHDSLEDYHARCAAK
jgi:hypothetical protein